MNLKKMLFLVAAYAVALCAHAAGTATVVCEGTGVLSWDPLTSTLRCPQPGSTTPPPDPVPIPPTPSDPFAGCPAGTMKISKLPADQGGGDVWGASAIQTSWYGTFGNQIVSVLIAPPVGWASTSAKSISWVEYQDGAVVRQWALSTVPCDFSAENAVKNKAGTRGLRSAGNNIGVSFSYQNSQATTFNSYAGVITPGKRYYLNIKNEYGPPYSGTSCGSGSCNMRGNVRQ